MSSPKSTPGPLTPVKVGLRWVIEAPNLERDADPGDTFLLVDDLSEADARLFSAAPELKLACEAALSAFILGDYVDQKQAMDYLKEALAKAGA